MAKKFEFNANSQEAVNLATKIANDSSLADSVAKMKRSHLSVILQDGDHITFKAGQAVDATFQAEVIDKDTKQPKKDRKGNVITEDKTYLALRGELTRDGEGARPFTASINAFLRDDFAEVLRDDDGEEITDLEIQDGNVPADAYLHRSDFRSRFGKAPIEWHDVTLKDGETQSIPVLMEDIEIDIVAATVFLPDYKAENGYDRDNKRYTKLVVKENYPIAELD